MEWIIFWLVCAIVVAVAAKGRGRSALAWFILACLISPLLAVILLALLRRADDGPSYMERHEGKARKCPFCAEYIKREAIVCKHCGRDIVPNSAGSAA